MAIIALDRVGETYPSQAGETEALNDVSLAVERGEFVSLIGPSGCPPCGPTEKGLYVDFYPLTEPNASRQLDPSKSAPRTE